MTRRPKNNADARSDPAPDPRPSADARSHMLFGWWALLIFLTFGALLEALHGFKVPAYLAVSNEARRLLWTLAHAHGTLLAIVNIVFALSLPALAGFTDRSRALASRSLLAATLLLPGGFFLGGAIIHGGDPGLGILLVPLGAMFLVVAVFLAARAATRGG